MMFLFCKVKHRKGKNFISKYYQRYIKQRDSPQKHLQIHKYELHYYYILRATNGHQETTKKGNSKYFQYKQIHKH